MEYDLNPDNVCKDCHHANDGSILVQNEDRDQKRIHLVIEYKDIRKISGITPADAAYGALKGG